MIFKIKSLGEICKFQGGSQPPKSNFIYEPKNGYIRFLQIRDFGSENNHTYIPEDKKNKICNSDDIMIGRYGASVGKILRGRGGAYNVALMKATPLNSLVNKEYLWNYFKSSIFQDNLKKVASRSAQDGFSKDDIFDFKVPLPPLPIQQKIVEKLDKIFAEIDKATAAAEANAKNTKLYIGKLSDEIIHEKLKKYKELTLNDITEVITCGIAKRPKYVESGIPFLSARNVKNGKMKWDRHEFVSEETHNTLSKYNKPKIGDILYSRVGAGFGDAAIIDKDIEFSIFVSLTLLKVKPVVLNEFLYYYLNSPFIKEVARKNITGTGVGNLNVGAVRLFNIKLPELKIQNEIVKKLNYISQNGKILIELYLKKLEQLSLLKQSILKQAFNGELVKAA